ncbi:hypothetical protein FBEOM_3657 [Fusarium beomiforme]|uniref:Uncharacterized protein n=1 Tax=Fusarium beomiforme TaxID=44412 RepID=A0A9P5APL9_9HYPO|nr:hypothetical protein FBEOM_3657 [Fusarium beomiforme]
MEWPQDNAGIGENGFERVFKYAPRETTIITMLARNQYMAKVITIESDAHWDDFCTKLPGPASGESGLVLLLARREGEAVVEAPNCCSLASLSEKSKGGKMGENVSPKPKQRGVRTLPFSKEAFRCITKSLYTHGSIAKAISRSDVPHFSSHRTIMEMPAHVYNFRTSNAWGDDLAMSATFFPHSNLTLSIVYGVSLSVERDIISWLSIVQQTQIHPLVVPAMLAEVERSRHDRLVKAQMIKIELWILESRFNPDDLEKPLKVDFNKQNDEKRAAWLNTTYLKNGLISWINQLRKMIQHMKEVEEILWTEMDKSHLVEQHVHESNQNPKPGGMKQDSAVDGCSTPEYGWEFLEQKKNIPYCEGVTAPRKDIPPRNENETMTHKNNRDDMSELSQDTQDRCYEREIFMTKEPESAICGHERNREQTPFASCKDTKELETPFEKKSHTSKREHRMGNEKDALKPNATLGSKVRERLLEIKEEYEDWVRECDMRVDGMAIAARWTQGETNVEIALSTRQDSRYMRSIAVITMIFLPGTWLAFSLQLLWGAGIM